MTSPSGLRAGEGEERAAAPSGSGCGAAQVTPGPEDSFGLRPRGVLRPPAGVVATFTQAWSKLPGWRNCTGLAVDVCW